MLPAKEVQVFIGKGNILQLEWDDLLFVVKGKADFVADMPGAVCVFRSQEYQSGTLPDRMDDLRRIVATRVNISGRDPASYAPFLQVTADPEGRVSLPG